MSRLCEIALLRKQARDELSVLEIRKHELEKLLHALDDEFEEERERLRARDELLADETVHERWSDSIDWALLTDAFEGGGGISEVDGTRSDA